MEPFMSAQIYIKDESFLEAAADILDKMKEDSSMGVSRVYSKEEARKLFGLGGDFSFIIESDGKTLFTSDWHEPLFTPAKELAPGYRRGSHGHDPSVSPQPVLRALVQH
ncbi:MAG: hypothetical protein ACTTJZ_01300 [Sphaerochaetaceae bacterium]